MVGDYHGGGQLEWNANLEVNKRAAAIIDALNKSRFNLTQINHDGETVAKPEEVLTHLIMLYQEISVELTEPEKEIWNDIKKLRDKFRNRPPEFKQNKLVYWQTSINDLDELNLKVRMLAKRRGFLASNKEDISKAGLRR